MNRIRRAITRPLITVLVVLLGLVLVVGIVYAYGKVKENQAMADIEAECIKIANEYVETELKTPSSEYRMAYQGEDAKSGLYVVEATHQEDLDPNRPLYPGAGSGKSLKLFIDLEAGKVTKALGWQ